MACVLGTPESYTLLSRVRSPDELRLIRIVVVCLFRNQEAGVRFLHEARMMAHEAHDRGNAGTGPKLPGMPLRFNWMNAAMVRRRQWVRIPPEAQ